MRLDGLLLRLDNCRILLGSRFFVAFEPAGPLSRPYTGYRYTSLTSDTIAYYIFIYFTSCCLHYTELICYYLRSQTAARATTRRDTAVPPRDAHTASSTVRSRPRPRRIHRGSRTGPRATAERGRYRYSAYRRF